MSCKMVGLALFLALPFAGQSSDEIRADLFKRINEVRAKDKVAPLVRDAKLDSAAQKHAENMAKQDKFGDDNKNGHVMDGKSPKERLAAEGISDTWIGENVAFSGENRGGENLAEVAVKMWVSSPGHYKNIMSEHFDVTGIGVARSETGRWYYCQTFAKKR